MQVEKVLGDIPAIIEEGVEQYFRAKTLCTQWHRLPALNNAMKLVMGDQIEMIGLVETIDRYGDKYIVLEKGHQSPWKEVAL